MKRVIIESPYAGDVATNLAYLQECIRDSLRRGEAPFASHQMYTQALDDRDIDQRTLGITAGFAWRASADLVVFYEDLGWSPGMWAAHRICQEIEKPIATRRIRP